MKTPERSVFQNVVHRLMPAVACVIAATISFASVPTAALAQVSPSITSAVNQARAHLNSGDGPRARAILDSLVGNAPRASDDLAEALYWRAVMSEQMGDAEQDWKRLIVDSPLSPRTPDALLRLGELEFLRGRPANARIHYARIVRDFSDTPQYAKAMVWTARSYFEVRDMVHACETVAALRAGAELDGELRLQLNEMQGRCDNAASRATAVTSETPAPGNSSATSTAKPASAPAATNGRYTVQLAATDTKAGADAMVKRFVSRGVKARVDGTRKPFRIRVGRYDTRAEANAALARLKKQGHKGFVAEIDR